MASLLSWLGNAAKGVERQINPFDNGATYRNPQGNGQHQSVVQQVVNRPIPFTGGTNSAPATVGSAIRAVPNFAYQNAGILPAVVDRVKQNPFSLLHPDRVLAGATLKTLAGLEKGTVNAIAGAQNSVNAIRAGNFNSGQVHYNQFLNSDPQQSLSNQAEQGGILPTAVNTSLGVLGPALALEGLKGVPGLKNEVHINRVPLGDEMGGIKLPQLRDNVGRYSKKGETAANLQAAAATDHARMLANDIKRDNLLGVPENPAKIKAYNEALKVAQEQRMSPLGILKNERGAIKLPGGPEPLPQLPELKQSLLDSSTSPGRRTTQEKLQVAESKSKGLSAQTSRNQSSSSLPNPTTKEYISQLEKAQQEARGKTPRLAGARSEFATKGLDALTNIEKPVEKALGGREANLPLRNQLDRSLRSNTIAGQYAKDSGLHEIVKSVPNTKEFDQYVIAKHAADLEKNGIKTGRDLAKDSQLVGDLAPKYEAQAKALGEYNNKLLDKTVDYGLISKDTAKYLKEKYPNYVPFDRIFTDAELAAQKGNGSGPASLSTQTVVQRIKGSDRQINSPLESILAKTHDVVAQGERNLAAKEIASTAKIPGNPLGLRELKPNEVAGNRSTISYIDNGVKRTFETTPEVAQAAKSLNQTQLGLVGKILSYPTRVLRLGATGLNVPFAAANVVKDSASAFINSSHPLKASVANPKVFMEALSASFRHGGKAYSELVREGAGGTSFDISRNAASDTIGKIRSERNAATKAAYTVRHPGELLRAVEDTIGRSEEFGRAMQYFGNKEAALKEGKPASQAAAYGADAARNNTVNFARAGEYGRVLNSVLPYFNAGIQGSRTLLRNLRDKPLQTGAKIAISASLPVAVTTAWNINDPKRKEAYDDIQDYEKEGNIIIVPSNPKKDPDTGKWNVIKIPVSQEIANLNNVIRNGIEALQKDKGFDFAGMVGNLTGTVTSLNAQSPRQLANQLTPQGLKPGIEALTNQNLFTGNQIIPDKMKNLDAKDQYGKNTSGTAKVLGGAIGIAPYSIDNTIRTSLGGLGQTGINATDTALAKLGVIKPEDIKGKTLQAGITGRFFGAQGQSQYAPIDKAIKTNADKLKATDGYKALSADEKAKALNRLQNDVITATKQQIDNGDTKLSPRQAGLLNGTTDVSSYLTTKATTAKVSAKDYNDFVNSSENYRTVGDTVLRRSADGTVTTQPKAKFDYQLGSATLASQKASGDVKGYLQTAQKQLQNISQQLRDPSIDPLEALTLQNQAAALQKNISRYKGYGGFTKGKSAKSSIGYKSVSTKTPSVPKISVKKLAGLKAPKTRKLSVTKIPSSYVSRKLA